MSLLTFLKKTMNVINKEPKAANEADKSAAPEYSGSASLWPQAFEDAYWRIMDGVILAQDVKERLYPEAREAVIEGAEDIEEPYIRHLRGQDWDWPLFDEWKKTFLRDNEFPCMWRSHETRIILEDIILKTDIDDENTPVPFHILAGIKVDELKKLTAELNITMPPKSKKADYLERFNNHLTRLFGKDKRKNNCRSCQ